MEITKDTRVSDILTEYGDIAEVMETFGIKRVGRYSVRRIITKALTVENAARVHRVPLDEPAGHPGRPRRAAGRIPGLTPAGSWLEGGTPTLRPWFASCLCEPMSLILPVLVL